MQRCWKTGHLSLSTVMGIKADYYTEFDGLYGWECYPKEKNARMRCVMGSLVAEENPHYLRFTAEESQAGFKKSGL